MQGGNALKRIIAILLCAVLLAGCQVEKLPYIPTGNGLYDDSTQTTAPTLLPGGTDQVLNLAYDGADSLNPLKSTGSTNRLIFPLLYQGLFSVDEAYNAIPILCKNYRISKDMKTYTIYLEPATFSDGSILTAEDVAASLLCAKESPVYQGRFQEMASVTATSDGAVEITMNIPYENLCLLLDVPIMKASQVEVDLPLGTGPYMLTGDQDMLVLQRRELWWCRADMSVTASYILLRDLRSSSQRRDAFEFGKISLLYTDPGTESHVDIRCDYELWDCESGLFLYLACNEKSVVFSDPAIRRALTHAIDRSVLVSNYYKDFAISATLPASPLSPYYDENLASQYGYDPDKFAQAIQQLPEDKRTIVLLVNQADGRRTRVAKAIAQMLTQFGLTVTVSALSGDQYTNALSQNSYDLHLGQTKLSANMDLTAFFHPKGTLNYGGLSDAICYSLCQEAMANTGNYYSLHRQIMNDGMLCPLLFRSSAIYVSRGLFDELSPARDNLFVYTLGKTLEQCKLDT